MKIIYRHTKSFMAITSIFLISILMQAGESPRDSNQIDTISCFDERDLEEYDNSDREKILFRRKPIIGGYWDNPPPPIRLCTESGVTESRLRRALGYWEKLGYEFGEISVEGETYACALGGHLGEITILLVTPEVVNTNNLAVTMTHKHIITKEIVRSQIYINRYAAEKILVLEHEIGHALGWLHFNTRTHIMNANYPHGGYTSSGVERSSYDDEVRRIVARD